MAVKVLTMRPLAIIAVIAFAVVLTVGIRWWIHSDAVAKESACIHNLIAIDSAKQQWALETRLPASSNATPLWADLAPYLPESFWEVIRPGAHAGFRPPNDPPHADYMIGPMSDSPTCSYSGRTFALYGLSVHVGDASVPAHDAEVLEIFAKPGEQRLGQRPFGRIAAANVTVLNGTGPPTKLATGDDGTAYLKVFSGRNHEVPGPEPVALIVSKEGFFTQSNRIRDPWQYDYNILLKPKPNENIQKPESAARTSVLKGFGLESTNSSSQTDGSQRTAAR